MKGAVSVFILCLAVFQAGSAGAAVSGVCSNCHVMHNSRDGSSVSSSPVDHLLVDDCVGCHSTTTAATIESLGGCPVPKVFNTGGYPASPLAGGNFYYPSQGGDYDQYGHNVLGIASSDSFLVHVPGKLYGGAPKTITECYNCHKMMPGGPFYYPRSGDILICVDCHAEPRHHLDDSAAVVVDGSGGWYRFINWVKGIEDSDWEQTVSSADHNEYLGETAAGGDSFSELACMCHGDFHVFSNPSGVGTGSPWLRHPSDIALPASGEYAAYTVYDPQVPVARPDLSSYSGPSAVVTPGTDQVTCVSCHRAHGSPYPDMLRWDYSAMLVNDPTNPAAGTGCFRCHSGKDD